jgi:hypothetical protein
LIITFVRMAALLQQRQDAQAVVRRIREENGGISAEDRAASRPAVLRALENVRRKLGSATKTYHPLHFTLDRYTTVRENCFLTIRFSIGLRPTSIRKIRDSCMS